MPLIDIAGERFGRLVALRNMGRLSAKRRDAMWECLCDCGVKKAVPSIALRAGNTVSCGCFRTEILRTSGRTHGASRQPGAKKHTVLYNRWAGMKKRCNNRNDPNYRNYGGRGIRVCDRWNDFVAFAADMGEPPSPDFMLERIDNEGNYEPSNCRWATKYEQAGNRRNSVRVTINGKTQCVRAWCKELGISEDTVRSRLARGIAPKDALLQRVRA